MKTLLKTIGISLFAVALYATVSLATSADISLGSNGREVECDGTQRTATLNTHGGSIMNKSTGSVWVSLDAGTVSTTSGGTSVEVLQNMSIKLPSSCGSFTFKTASGTSYLVYVGP